MAGKFELPKPLGQDTKISLLEAEIRAIEETEHPSVSSPETASKLRELKQQLTQLKTDKEAGF